MMSESSSSFHTPVLLQEVLDGLQCRHGGLFLDGTLGCGGHARAILEHHPENRLIGVDRDQEALAIAARVLRPFEHRVRLYHQRFEHIERILQVYGQEIGFSDSTLPACLDGVLLDLGVSSMQLDRAERGFSFQQTAWLDMRMDQQDSRTAYDLINTASAEELADIFFRYGEERQSRRIARRIVEFRHRLPIETTTQLAELVASAVPRRFHPKHIHPATRVFQALRIAVNDELHNLAETLEHIVAYLKPSGRICVIAFHSLEDRIVKQTFQKLATSCLCPPDFPVCVCGHTASLTPVSRKPVTASPAEQRRNPRSRSAKLRIAQKICCCK